MEEIQRSENNTRKLGRGGVTGDGRQDVSRGDEGQHPVSKRTVLEIKLYLSDWCTVVFDGITKSNDLYTSHSCLISPSRYIKRSFVYYNA